MSFHMVYAYSWRIKLIHVSSVGRFGRMWLAGSEAEILTAKNAAIQALEALEGQAGG